MTFLFANLRDRGFLVQKISDFLQRTPSRQPGSSGRGRNTSAMDPAPEVRGPLGSSRVAGESGPGEELWQPSASVLEPAPCEVCCGPWARQGPTGCWVESLTQSPSQVAGPHTHCPRSHASPPGHAPQS